MIDNNIDHLTKTMNIKAKVLLDVALNYFKLDVYIFEGKRTLDRQKQLFGYGRSIAMCQKYGVPAQYAKPKEKKRTWTLDSYHLYGKAVDIVFDLNKDPKVYKPSWNGSYGLLIGICSYIGLRNLSPLEVCHFEDNGISINSIMESNGKLWHTSDDKKREILHFINESFRKYIK